MDIEEIFEGICGLFGGIFDGWGMFGNVFDEGELDFVNVEEYLFGYDEEVDEEVNGGEFGLSIEWE